MTGLFVDVVLFVTDRLRTAVITVAVLGLIQTATAVFMAEPTRGGPVARVSLAQP